VKIPHTSFHRGVHTEICQAHVRAGRPHAEPAQTVIPDVEYFALQVIPFLKKLGAVKPIFSDFRRRMKKVEDFLRHPNIRLQSPGSIC
jgi:hypothetical protein